MNLTLKLVLEIVIGSSLVIIFFLIMSEICARRSDRLAKNTVDPDRSSEGSSEMALDRQHNSYLFIRKVLKSFQICLKIKDIICLYKEIMFNELNFENQLNLASGTRSIFFDDRIAIMLAARRSDRRAKNTLDPDRSSERSSEMAVDLQH